MKKSVSRNYIYNLVYQVFSIITPFITTPYVSRVLGSDGVGQYSFTYSIATYFVLLGSLGFGYYAQREIASKQGFANEQSKIFWEILICRLLMVLLSSSVYVLLIFLNVYDESYSNLMWILLINVLATAFDIVFLFQGNEEFGTILFRNIAIKCVGIALIFIFVKQRSDIGIYVFCQSITLLLANLSLWLKVPKKLVRVHLNDLNFKRHFLPSLKLFIPTLAISVYTMLDKTLIGVLIPGVNEAGVRIADIENGNYEQSEKIVKMALTLLTSIGIVMLPRNSQNVASGNYVLFKANIHKVLRFVFLLGLPLMFGISAIAFNFSPWFFGNGFDKVPFLMMMFSPIIVIIGISNVFGLQYLIPLKKDKHFTISIVAGAAVNLLLNLVLIPFFGSYGACFATIIGELCVTFCMAFFARKDVSVIKELLLCWKYVISAILMFAAVFVTQLYLPSSILNTIILVFEGIIIYICLILLLRDEFFLTILKSIERKIKKEG